MHLLLERADLKFLVIVSTVTYYAAPDVYVTVVVLFCAVSDIQRSVWLRLLVSISLRGDGRGRAVEQFQPQSTTQR
jgi:hypothetical protein